MAETLVELVARISADASQLKKGLKSAEGDVDDFGKTVEKKGQSVEKQFLSIGKTIGLITVALTGYGAGILAIAKSFGNAGEELLEMSQKTGMSVESLSELKYVAELSNVSLGDLQIAFRGMSNVMETARGGGEEALNTFTKLGIKFTELKGLNSEQLFMKLASTIASIPDPMQRAALAQDIFGRSGMNLLPILADGADGIERLREEARRLGITMSTETARQADALGDAMETSGMALKGFKNAVISIIGPDITNMSNVFSTFMGNATGWIKGYGWGASEAINGVKGTIDQTKSSVDVMGNASANAFLMTAKAAQLAAWETKQYEHELRLARESANALANMQASIIASRQNVALREYVEKQLSPFPGGLSDIEMNAILYKAQETQKLKELGYGGRVSEYQSGGIVPGAIGAPQLAMVHGGETIIPANESGGSVVINVAGSLVTEREISRIMHNELLRLGRLNQTTGIS